MSPPCELYHQGGLHSFSYEVDTLLYPNCRVHMHIISFIDDHKVIDKIISHLKLSFMAEQPPPPQRVQQELLMAAEEMGEYF